MIVDSLNATVGNLEELADEIGVSYATLHAWRTNRRNPSPENLARLAEAIERRSDRLRALAEELRRAAGEG